MKTSWIVWAILALAVGPAIGQIKVGVSVSATGPAASLGIAQKNTFSVLPKKIAGQNVEYIVLDDGTDATMAVRNAQKLISEQKVDLLIGSTVVPASLAMSNIATAASTPMISMAASAALVQPTRPWIFKTPPNDVDMLAVTIAHMAQVGVKTIAFIGFADTYGESWYRALDSLVAADKMKIVANERFARTDTSVTAQVLKMVSTQPDAVLIAAAGTPAALPQKTLKQRGYKGKIYQTLGAANADFLRVCGKDCEGTFLAAGPLLVAEQLTDGDPIKKSAMAYRHAYEAVYGVGSSSTFGGNAWDAGMLLAAAAPSALKRGRPGSPQFRAALRDSLEQVRQVPAAQGILNMSAARHVGFDQRSLMMVEIVNGKWKLLGTAD